MHVVRGSWVRMASSFTFSCRGVAPAASGALGSTPHTSNSGHGSTVTLRRILYSARCFCRAPSAELSHSRRKAGASSAHSGSLRGQQCVVLQAQGPEARPLQPRTSAGLCCATQAPPAQELRGITIRQKQANAAGLERRTGPRSESRQFPPHWKH